MAKNHIKVLVTGGTGYIGSNLVKELYKRKCKITIFAKNKSHQFLNGLKVKRIDGDVRDYNSVLKAVKGCDYVYHLAACSSSNLKDVKELFDVNVTGTENVMRACLESKVKKVVHVSSGSTLGFSRNERKKLNENDCIDFKDQPYAQSKKLGEDKVQEYVAKGLNVSIVLPSYVIGAGEIDSSRFGLFKSISNDRIKFTYPGGGGSVAVEDLVDGIILAMEKGKAGERYIISNENRRIFYMYNIIARLLKKPRIRFCFPRMSYYPMYLLGFFLQKLMKNPKIATETVRWAFNYRYYDSGKARKELGWKPKVSLGQSLKRAMIYYKKIGVLK